MNGDILTTLDLNALVSHHRQAKATLTIACHSKRVQLDLGVLELDEQNGRVTGYLEKPEYTYPVSMGVYVYEPEALDYIGRNEYLDFPSLVLRLLERDKKVAYYTNNDIWLDIGRREDYAQAQEIFEKHHQEFRLVK
jgi:NDP-sugar pyrophosphorylase family protein